MNIISSVFSTQTKAFAVINTTEYNEDGSFAVQVVEVTKEELEDKSNTILGWEVQENCEVQGNGYRRSPATMEVGETLVSNEYDGAYIMRLK